MQTSTKITDFFTSQFVNTSGICIMQSLCLLQGYFFHQSQPGSWAKLTDPAFIPALPGPALCWKYSTMYFHVALGETLPQLPVPNIEPFIPFLFSLGIPGRSCPRREDFLEGLHCKPDLVAPGCSMYEVFWQGQLMLIVCKQLTGQPWYLSVNVALHSVFTHSKKKFKNKEKIMQFSNVSLA